jgi:hypothetical protein
LLLGALLGGVSWALGRSLMTKMGSAPAAPAVELAALELLDWQLVESQALEAKPLKMLKQMVAGDRATKAIPVFATYPVAAARSLSPKWPIVAGRTALHGEYSGRCGAILGGASGWHL